MATNAAMSSSRTSGLPRGELLGRYRSYEDAQKVVDHLAASEDFDIKSLTIVGNDLRSVEHIRSRLSYPKVAGAGAAQGAMFGAFIGLLLVLFSPEAELINLLLAVLLGTAIWMIVGVVGYAVRRGRRDFASSSQLVATTFDVVCDFSVAARARDLVQSSGVTGVTAAEVSAQKSPTLQGPTPQSPTPAERSGQTRPTSYGDLPDGRPRYGVRTDAAPDDTDDTAGDDPKT